MKNNYLLLRYLEEKPFVDMFMAGDIRMNSLGFFWGEHDEPTKNGQIDTSEGLTCPIDAKSSADCTRNDGYRYCNLLCCHRLEYENNGDQIKWCLDSDMEHFGDYVVIIKDRNAFQRRLIRAAERAGYKCGCCSVDYSSRYTNERDVFDKESEYAYQNEWRAALYRDEAECEPYVISIGSIADIAEWCKTTDLLEHIESIFTRRDYKNSQERYYGNIDRSELAQLFLNL